MKYQMIVSLCCLLSLSAAAQKNRDSPASNRRMIGIKGGLNFNYISDVLTFKSSNNTGFIAGAYFAPRVSSRWGFRSELLFSRQGYDYQNHSTSGSVMLDYIMLPQLTTFNIRRFLQLQAGGQVAFLLNNKIDSMPGPSSIPVAASKNIFSKINYGFAAGLELRPVAGLMVGGRYNLFFDLFNNQQTTTVVPSYAPINRENVKNGLLQLYAGYHF